MKAVARKRKRRQPTKVAGWREWVGLPELGIDAVKAKLDTGARSSALHALAMRPFSADDGTPMIAFEVHPIQRDAHTTVEVVAELLGEREVRDSGGKLERRPLIRTIVELGDKRWRIEVTLTRRDKMGFRMLLGRSALKRRYVVDPGASFIVSTAPSPPSDA